MADIFSHNDTKALLKNKRVLLLGDSNIRRQYKDLVWLLNSNTLITESVIRRKLEMSYLGDNLINRHSKLHHGRDFQEVRQYIDKSNQTVVDFMFVTRCYNNQIEKLFSDIKRRMKPIPDIVVMCSCLWDLTRWGPNGVPQYKDNMVKLMRLMRQSLPRECLVIWTTALAAAAHIRGGLIIKQIEAMEPLMRFEVMEANTFAREIVVAHGFDVLDNHYYTRMQIHRRAKDGVHYMPVPVRLMTNLFLTHVALSWGCALPNNISSLLLNKAIALDSKPAKESSVKLPTDGIFSKINLASPVTQRTRGLKVTFDANEEGNSRSCQLSIEKPQRSSTLLQQPYSVSSGNQPQAQHEGPIRRKNKKKKKRKGPYPTQQQYPQYGYYNCTPYYDYWGYY